MEGSGPKLWEALRGRFGLGDVGDGPVVPFEVVLYRWLSSWQDCGL